jgi:hypothetical protein
MKTSSASDWAEKHGAEEALAMVRASSGTVTTWQGWAWENATMSKSVYGVLCSGSLFAAVQVFRQWWDVYKTELLLLGNPMRESLRSAIRTTCTLSFLLSVSALSAAYLQHSWGETLAPCVFVPLVAADDEGAELVEFDLVPTTKELNALNAACAPAGRMDVDLYVATRPFQATGALPTTRQNYMASCAAALDSVLNSIGSPGNGARLDAAIVDSFSNSVAAYQRQSAHFRRVAEQAGVTRQMVLSLSRVAETDGLAEVAVSVGALLTKRTPHSRAVVSAATHSHVASLLAHDAVLLSGLSEGAPLEGELTSDQQDVFVTTAPLVAEAIRVLDVQKAVLTSHVAMQVRGYGLPAGSADGVDRSLAAEVTAAFASSNEETRRHVAAALAAEAEPSTSSAVERMPDDDRKVQGAVLKVANAMLGRVGALEGKQRQWLEIRDTIVRVGVSVPLLCLGALELWDARSRTHLGKDEPDDEDCLYAVAAQAGLLGVGTRDSAREAARELLADPGNFKLRRAHRKCLYDARAKTVAAAADNGLRIMIIVVVLLSVMSAIRSQHERLKKGRRESEALLKEVTDAMDVLDDYTSRDGRIGSTSPGAMHPTFPEALTRARRARLDCRVLDAAREPVPKELEVGQVVTYTVLAVACVMAIMIAHKHLNAERQVTRIRELVGVLSSDDEQLGGGAQVGGGPAPRELVDEYERLVIAGMPAEVHTVSVLAFMAVCGFSIYRLIPEAF